jgi:DNA-binding response OmpR family regulator
LILSARSEEADKVRGLRTGADDFVTKPFGVQELVERVRALLRRAGTSPAGELPDRVHVGVVEIDVAARRAHRGGEPVLFTPLEFELLLTLARHPGVALSRAALLRDVWGHAPDVQTRTVDLHVAELRRKIEPVPHEPRHIITVFKTGYRFDP